MLAFGRLSDMRRVSVSSAAGVDRRWRRCRLWLQGCTTGGATSHPASAGVASPTIHRGDTATHRTRQQLTAHQSAGPTASLPGRQTSDSTARRRRCGQALARARVTPASPGVSSQSGTEHSLRGAEWYCRPTSQADTQTGPCQGTCGGQTPCHRSPGRPGRQGEADTVYQWHTG